MFWQHKFIEAADEYNALMFAIAEEWSTKADHMPGTARLSICIQHQDSNNDWQGGEVTNRIREVVSHFEWRATLCTRNKRLRVATPKIPL